MRSLLGFTRLHTTWRPREQQLQPHQIRAGLSTLEQLAGAESREEVPHRVEVAGERQIDWPAGGCGLQAELTRFGNSAEVWLRTRPRPIR